MSDFPKIRQPVPLMIKGNTARGSFYVGAVLSPLLYLSWTSQQPYTVVTVLPTLYRCCRC